MSRGKIVKRGNGDRCEEEAESRDRIGTQEDSEGATVRTVPTSLGGVDKETGSYETDHLDTDEWTIPYLTHASLMARHGPHIRALSEDISLAASDKDLYRSEEGQAIFADDLGEAGLCCQGEVSALEQGDEDEEDDDHEEQDHEDEGLNTMEAEELAQLIKAYDNLGLPENIDLGRDDWISALKHRTYLAIGAIIALSLPSLENFEIVFPNSVEDSSKFIRRAIQAATPQNLPSVAGRFLSNLREVEYFQAALEFIIPLNEIRSYFYLPSLRTLEVNHLEADAFTWSPPLTSCNIETLSLETLEMRGTSTRSRMSRLSEKILHLSNQR
ncbi:hypothetical protein O988_02275 [Pseudogymnoascus sp. VKM F-3808]|nr:hypothetical protein O988_02275 [Pseudogymnoascus sp. VKM F-3808]